MIVIQLGKLTLFKLRKSISMDKRQENMMQNLTIQVETIVQVNAVLLMAAFVKVQ